MLKKSPSCSLPSLHGTNSTPSLSFSLRYHHLAALSHGTNVETVQYPHAVIGRRGCQSGTGTLPEESGNKEPHLNHHQMDGNASSRTRGEWLVIVLDQRLALRGREPASVIKTVHACVSVAIGQDSNTRAHSRLWVIPCRRIAV